MNLVKDVDSEVQFEKEIQGESTSSSNNKLIVIDFYAIWCGPCKTIAPFVHRLSVKFPHVTFLKVDVEKFPVIAEKYNVNAMPTFVFLKNRLKIDELKGANTVGLEAKVNEHAGENPFVEGDVAVKGQMDLMTLIRKENCECMNELNNYGLNQALEKGSGYLQSDADEQLIIYLVFNQVVKIHSIRFDAPLENGPKNVKFYINQTTPPDFESCIDTPGVQELELTEDDLKEGNLNALKFVKFQNVLSLTIFVQDNQQDQNTTRINYLAIYGKPVATTNMNEFKRVAGKKGEVSM